MRTVADIQASKVFDSFQSYAGKLEIETVAADIKHVSDRYRKLEHTTDPEEATFLYRWEVMQAGVITPVLLLLFSAPEDQLAAHRRVRSLKILESFLVRRMVCRLTTKDYNRLTLDVAEVLQRRGLDRADEVILEFLKSQTADAREWPSDKKIREAFLSLPLYGLLTRGRLRLVLEGIDEALRTLKAEHKDAPRDLTIEHVMPQSWHEHWPSTASGLDEETAAAERNRLIHTIGNLSLVNGALNPALTNAPWPRKLEELGRHGVLFLNKAILEGWGNEDWNEEAIRSRSVLMADLPTAVWPGSTTGE